MKFKEVIKEDVYDMEFLEAFEIILREMKNYILQEELQQLFQKIDISDNDKKPELMTTSTPTFLIDEKELTDTDSQATTIRQTEDDEDYIPSESDTDDSQATIIEDDNILPSPKSLSEETDVDMMGFSSDTEQETEQETEQQEKESNVDMMVFSSPRFYQSVIQSESDDSEDETFDNIKKKKRRLN